MRRAPTATQLLLLSLTVLLSTPLLWAQAAPSPLLKSGQPVDWWYAFKFNAETFLRPKASKPTCLFGGTPGGKRKYTNIGQTYVVASSDHPALADGAGFLGDSLDDPLGATYDEVYNGTLSFIVWNDQFYRDPVLACEGTVSTLCGPKWGHSKGLLAWDDNGDGFILQVTTPSWPGAGNKDHPRTDGNSLGCVNDNDVQLSQGFYSLKLNKGDVVQVLQALQTEGAVTDPANPQIAKIGGPQEVKDAAAKLGSSNKTSTFTQTALSSGVKVIAKAGGLAAPPWQFVSAVLGKVPLRVASFWQLDVINSTPGRTQPDCWPDAVKSTSPGAVQIALTGIWNGTTIGLSGTAQKSASGKNIGANHAKLAVSTDGSSLTIFSDMNQDGAISPVGTLTCTSSQNGRGGLFFVVENVALHDSVAALLTGKSAPLRGAAARRAAPKPAPTKTGEAHQ